MQVEVRERQCPRLDLSDPKVAWKSFSNCLSTCSETRSFQHSRSRSDNMHISGSVSSQPQARDPRRIGLRLLSAKSTQHNFTKLAKRRSIALASTTFKRSQAIGSNCEVVQQELRVFHKPSEDRGRDRNKCAVTIGRVLSKYSHLCVEELLTVANSSLRLFPLSRAFAKCSSTKFRSHSLCKCNHEASGSACKTPKVLPVSSMKRPSSPSAYTQRPLLGTCPCQPQEVEVDDTRLSRSSQTTQVL